MNKEKSFRKLFKSSETELPIDIPKFAQPKQLIIIGGGTSIKEGISKGLWDKLKERFTLGINYSFHYFKSTIETYIDADFYIDEWDDLKSLPLIIGKYHKLIEKEIRGSTIMLQVNDSTYTRDLKEGIYKSSLCGLFSLSLGIHLLNKGEIFLLGYDHNDNGKKDKKGKLITHFYQGEIKHRGIGKVNYYKAKGRADRDFSVYSEEKKIKIYNVSVNSCINIFTKIDYSQFFEMLDNNIYDQVRLRQWVREKLKGKTL